MSKKKKKKKTVRPVPILSAKQLRSQLVRNRRGEVHFFMNGEAVAIGKVRTAQGKVFLIPPGHVFPEGSMSFKPLHKNSYNVFVGEFYLGWVSKQSKDTWTYRLPLWMGDDETAPCFVSRKEAADELYGLNKDFFGLLLP